MERDAAELLQGQRHLELQARPGAAASADVSIAALRMKQAQATLNRARQEFSSAAQEHADKRAQSLADLQKSVDAVHAELRDKVEVYRCWPCALWLPSNPTLLLPMLPPQLLLALARKARVVTACQAQA